MSQRRKLSVPQVPAISRDVASSPRAKLVAVPTTPRTIVPFRGPEPRIARPTLVSCAPVEAEPRPARTPQAFLKQIAPIILGVTGGQMMPFWDRLWKAVSAGQTHRMYVVASEDTGSHAAVGVFLAEEHFGEGRVPLFVCASGSPGCKALTTIWTSRAAMRPWILVTGECASRAPQGTVQDGRDRFVSAVAAITGGTSSDITDPDTAWTLLIDAPAVALATRRPVHLNITLDAQAGIWR